MSQDRKHDKKPSREQPLKRENRLSAVYADQAGRTVARPHQTLFNKIGTELIRVFCNVWLFEFNAAAALSAFNQFLIKCLKDQIVTLAEHDIGKLKRGPNMNSVFRINVIIPHGATSHRRRLAIDIDEKHAIFRTKAILERAALAAIDR